MEQADEVAAALAALVAEGRLDLPLPGGGATAVRFDALAEVAAGDLSLARLAEGHVDAVAILAEADRATEPDQRYGVWAADPPDGRLTWDGAGLHGRKRYCSGAPSLTRALVTAFAPHPDLGAGNDRPTLFLVDLGDPRVAPVPGTWPAIGMAGSASVDVTFDGVPAEAVCRPGWYLDRPGFWAGAVQVAACWYGGAVGARRMLERRLAVGEADPHALAHLGAATAACDAMAAVLQAGAAAIDAGGSLATGAQDRRLALSVRATVEAGCTSVLDHVGRASGSSAMAFDPAHARRVADLPVYLRQSHAERDLAELGRLVLGECP